MILHLMVRKNSLNGTSFYFVPLDGPMCPLSAFHTGDYGARYLSLKVLNWNQIIWSLHMEHSLKF
jgi:hypothetical protein